MSRNKNRDKGCRIEREVVKAFLEANIPALRIPLSGAARGFKNDVLISGVYSGECKSRKNGVGFATLTDWKGDADILFLHQNHKPIHCYLTLDLLISLMHLHLEGHSHTDAS